MSNSPVTTIDIASTGAQPEASSSAARQRWFELCLVLLVACGTAFLNALNVLKNGTNAVPHMTSDKWLIGIVQEVTALLLLGYVLSRRSLRFKDLGLRWSLGDVGVGLLVAGSSFAAYLLGSTVVHVFHYAIYGVMAGGPSASAFFAHPSVAAIPFSLLNPFFEELIVRAYLMTEVLDLTGSSTLAVALSVAVQSSYHLYYGWAGAISLSFQFLIFALYYARSRRALPVIVAHGLFDIYGLVRLW
jgi:membrane protease YdiL (CAAX protease family)